MVTKKQQIVAEYFIVEWGDFAKLLSESVGDIDKKISFEFQQVDKKTGSHGPKMKLSERSAMKIFLVDESQNDIQKQLIESQSQIEGLEVETREDGMRIVKEKDGSNQ